MRRSIRASGWAADARRIAGNGDHSGAAGGVSIRDLSDETVAEGIRGMKRKDSKFKDDQKKYTNEYPKSFREPGTMSKSEMRDHIEASVRRYLRSGGKINKS